GDIITAINGTPLTSSERLIEAMRALKVGDTLRVRMFRDGDYSDVEYVLPERPVLPGDMPGQSSLAPVTRARQRPPARTPPAPTRPGTPCARAAGGPAGSCRSCPPVPGGTGWGGPSSRRSRFDRFRGSPHFRQDTSAASGGHAGCGPRPPLGVARGASRRAGP